MIIPQGRLKEFQIKIPFNKIISLVPSISWFLFDLQLQFQIKAITKFCEASASQHLNYPTIGGTKNPDLNKIDGFKPDLILANKEENRKEDIEELSKEYCVYVSDIHDLESMYQMMTEISYMTDRLDIGSKCIDQIKEKYAEFAKHRYEEPPINVVYLIWKKPYMTIGKDTFIHFMIHLAGMNNCFHEKTRYPVITLNDIQLKQDPLVLLSSEPYPFNDSHLSEFGNLKTHLVDGRMFSWYGSFVSQSFDYLDTLKKSLKK